MKTSFLISKFVFFSTYLLNLNSLIFPSDSYALPKKGDVVEGEYIVKIIPIENSEEGEDGEEGEINAESEVQHNLMMETLLHHEISPMVPNVNSENETNLKINSKSNQSNGAESLFHIKMNSTKMNSFKRKFKKQYQFVEPVYRIYADDVKENDIEKLSQETFPSIPTIPSKQWGLEHPNNFDINITGAWLRNTGDKNVIVAIIDSGIDDKHTHLINQIWINNKEIPGNDIDDDNNGYVDDISGWDFYGSDNRPFDLGSHGTHVSGIVAGNGNLVMGVAPNISLMPLRFLGANGSGTTAGAIKAIYYAINNGAQVINASWGGGGYSQALYDAILDASNSNVLFVTSSGNNGVNLESSKKYPASYKLKNMVVVGSSTNTGTKSSFSNYGLYTVNVFAPGSEIYSTIPGGYGYKNGTSMASPFVAGLAGLILSQQPNFTNFEVKDIILKSVRKFKAFNGVSTTGGLIDATKALQLIE